MANETEYSNFQTVAAYVEANAIPHFRSAAIMPGLCKLINFRNDSDSVKLRKAGSLTATAATESTDHSVSEYTETSPATLTAAQVKVYAEVSDKALKFSGHNWQELAVEAGRAIAQKFDVDAMALFDAFNGGTQVGTSGADCSPEILLQASYTVRAQAVPGQLVYVLHPTQVYDVQSDLITSGASVWTNETRLDILNGQPPASNGYIGSFNGIPVYESTNTESVNVGADWAGACFVAGLALAAGFAGGIEVESDRNIKKGVTAVAVTLWYDVKEASDVAGVSIETDQ
jgi:hypothetical protein